MAKAEFVTPEGRMSYPHLLEPQASDLSDTKKYSVTLLLPKDGPGVNDFMKRLKAGIAAKVEERWPNPKNRPAKPRLSVKDGDSSEFEQGRNAGKLRKEVNPEVAGCWIITATANEQYPPSVVDKHGNVITSNNKIKPGFWARISFNLFAYENKQVGVSCGLQNVMVTREDETFGSSSRPEDDFSGFFDAAGEEALAGSDGKAEAVSDDSMFL